VGESSPKVTSLHEIQGVVVPEGGASRDPRLDSIDLRGKLVQRQVRVFGADGQPMAQLQANFALRTSDGMLRASRGHSFDEEGWCRFLAPLELTSLQLGVAGHRIATLNPNALTQEVRLERGLRVRIELGADAPELPAGFEYTLRLSRADPNPDWTASFGSYDRRGYWARPVSASYECDVPAPGRYLLRWSLQRGEGSDQPPVPLAEQRNATIEVGELSEMQFFRRTPQAEGVEATLLHFDHE
jgi:hypothetical protein